MSPGGSRPCHGGPARRNAGSPRLAEWLSLAAAPTFAAMALLTGVLESRSGPMLCLGGEASPMGGMASMYLLMSLFHSGAWLKLLFGSEVIDGPPRLGRVGPRES